MSKRLRLPLISVPLVVVLIAAPGSAQDVDAAEALYNKGLSEMNAGQYKSGCAAIGESYRLDPLPGALFTLAECHAKAGNVATAVARYDEYLRVFAGLPVAQQAKQRAKGRDKTAAAQKAALGPRVPELTLTLPASTPKGTLIVQDDVQIDDASIGIGRPIDPGDHNVTTQAPGGPVTENRFTVAESEKKRIELKVRLKAPEANADSQPKPVPVSSATAPLAAVPPPATAPEVPQASSASGASSAYRVGMYTAWGVGSAGLVVGLVTGGLAWGKQDAIEQGCDEAIDGKAACDPEALDAAHSAQTLELASTIGFAVGIAGLATGAVLLVMKPEKTPDRSSMRWVSVGVASAGGVGAIAIAKGAW